jgi:hypothetical protein
MSTVSEIQLQLPAVADRFQKGHRRLFSFASSRSSFGPGVPNGAVALLWWFSAAIRAASAQAANYTTPRHWHSGKRAGIAEYPRAGGVSQKKPAKTKRSAAAKAD